MSKNSKPDMSFYRNVVGKTNNPIAKLIVIEMLCIIIFSLLESMYPISMYIWPCLCQEGRSVLSGP